MDAEEQTNIMREEGSTSPEPLPPGRDLADLAREPYMDVFGRFWDGMSFLIASGRGASDRLGGGLVPPRFTMGLAGEALNRYLSGLPSGEVEWPREYLLWQMFAHTIVESHGLLDEYLRACYELLLLSKLTAEEIDISEGWTDEVTGRAAEIEQRAQNDAERFSQMVLWNRLTRMRKLLGVKARFNRELTAALQHQRAIRNGIVHGQLTPHMVMPDGTIGRIHAYAPPPYVPLGIHVVRGAMSVVLAAHRVVDRAIMRRLDIAEDTATTALIEGEIAVGRAEWFVDPWEYHPEHLFEPDVLRGWNPGV